MKRAHGNISVAEKIAYTALLVAMQVLLGKILTVPFFLPIKRINFGFLPVAVAGGLFGNLYAVLVGALGDVIGALLFPVGPLHLGFTLTWALVGLLFGLFLYRHKVSWFRVVTVCLLVSACNLFLNSYWLASIRHINYWVQIGERILFYLVDAPISCVVVYFVLKGLQRVNHPLFLPAAGK